MTPTITMFYGIVSAFVGTLAINYAFTFPYFAFNFTIPVNLISALIMITIALLTGALTTKVKYQEAIKAESEKERMRANLLRAVSHDIRTPLTTIYGSAAILLESKDDLSETQIWCQAGRRDVHQKRARRRLPHGFVTKTEASLFDTVLASGVLFGHFLARLVAGPGKFDRLFKRARLVINKIDRAFAVAQDVLRRVGGVAAGQ